LFVKRVIKGYFWTSEGGSNGRIEKVVRWWVVFEVLTAVTLKSIMGCNGVENGRSSTTFRRNVLPPSSCRRIRQTSNQQALLDAC
jgi:hypothetical protein